MQKRLLGAASLVGVAALLMSACGGSTPTPPRPRPATPRPRPPLRPPPSTTTGAPVRDASVDLVIWSDADRATILKKYADQFGQEQGIKVQIQVSTDVRKDFKAATDAGKGPDIIIGAHDWLGELVPERRRRAAQPVRHRRRLQSRRDPGVHLQRPDCTACPTPSRTSALVRNTDLVPDAPATFEEMIADRLRLQGRARRPIALGLAVQVGPQGDAYHLQPFLSAFGGYIFAQNADGTYNPDRRRHRLRGLVKGATWSAGAGHAGCSVADVTYDTMIRRSAPARRRSTSPARGRSARPTTASATGVPTRSGRSRRWRTAAHRSRSSACRASWSRRSPRRRTFAQQLRARLHEPGIESSSPCSRRAAGRRRSRRRTTRCRTIPTSPAFGTRPAPTASRMPTIPAMSYVWGPLGHADG